MAKNVTSFSKKMVASCLLVALVCYYFIDYPLLPYLALIKKEGRSFFKFLSFMIFPPFLLIGSIGGFIFFRLRKLAHTTLFLELALGQCLSVAFVRILKVIVGRARPDAFLEKGLNGFHFFHSQHAFHSFPSGHTMGIFTFAATLAFAYPRFRPFFFTLALFFSSSRVFLLDHFLSDVLITAVWALLISETVHRKLHLIIHSHQGELDHELTS